MELKPNNDKEKCKLSSIEEIKSKSYVIFWIKAKNSKGRKGKKAMQSGTKRTIAL